MRGACSLSLSLYIYVYMFTYICMYTCNLPCMYVCVYMYIHIYSVCVCIYVYVSALRIRVHAHLQVYTYTLDTFCLPHRYLSMRNMERTVMVMLLGIVTVMATGGADGGGVDGEEEDYHERGSDELHLCCLLLLLPMWISTKLMMNRLNVMMMINIGEDHSVDVIVMTWGSCCWSCCLYQQVDEERGHASTRHVPL